MKSILTNLIDNSLPFANEYDFQFELGYMLREKGYNVKIEQPVYNNENSKSNRCDIVATKNNKAICIELKYVYQNKNKNCTSDRARRSFIDDATRLKCLNNKEYQEKYCIFVTNKEVVYSSKKSTANSGKLKDFKENYSSNFKQTKWKNEDVVYYLIEKC